MINHNPSTTSQHLYTFILSIHFHPYLIYLRSSSALEVVNALRGLSTRGGERAWGRGDGQGLGADGLLLKERFWFFFGWCFISGFTKVLCEIFFTFIFFSASSANPRNWLWVWITITTRRIGFVVSCGWSMAAAPGKLFCFFVFIVLVFVNPQTKGFEGKPYFLSWTFSMNEKTLRLFSSPLLPGFAPRTLGWWVEIGRCQEEMASTE